MLAFFCGAVPVINTMSEASFRMLLHTASQKTEMHHGSNMTTSELIAVKLVKLSKQHCNFTTSPLTIDQFWDIAKTLCTSCVQLQTSQFDALFDMGIHLEINPAMPPRAYHFRFFAEFGHDDSEDLGQPYNNDIYAVPFEAPGAPPAGGTTWQEALTQVHTWYWTKLALLNLSRLHRFTPMNPGQIPQPIMDVLSDMLPALCSEASLIRQSVSDGCAEHHH